jgi:hypothetical protein
MSANERLDQGCRHRFVRAYAALAALAIVTIAGLAGAHGAASESTARATGAARAGRLAAAPPPRPLAARDLTLPAATFAATGFALDPAMTGATTLEMVGDGGARARMRAAGRVGGWRVTYRDDRSGRPLKQLTSGAAVYASTAGATDVIAHAPVPLGLIEQPSLDTFYDRTRLFVSPDTGPGRVVVIVWQDGHAVLSVTLIGDGRMELPFAFLVAGQAAAWTHPRAVTVSGGPVA